MNLFFNDKAPSGGVGNMRAHAYVIFTELSFLLVCSTISYVRPRPSRAVFW